MDTKMTDRDYEKMMVEAVNGGVDIGHVMHVLNTKIAVAEQMVESLYETRRELINRFNMNKGDTNVIDAGKISGVKLGD